MESIEMRQPRTVVVGYDGSDAARSAVFRAAEAAGAGGRLLLVTSVPSPDAPEVEREAAVDGEHLLEEAEALLRRHELEVETRVEEGDPAEALVAVACETDADLIVVGARGRSYPARALRGSVAERLVSRAPCNLLVVHAVTGIPRLQPALRRWGRQPIGAGLAPRHAS